LCDRWAISSEKMNRPVCFPQLLRGGGGSNSPFPGGRRSNRSQPNSPLSYWESKAYQSCQSTLPDTSEAKSKGYREARAGLLDEDSTFVVKRVWKLTIDVQRHGQNQSANDEKNLDPPIEID
jgi:hypothetical protein